MKRNTNKKSDYENQDVHYPIGEVDTRWPLEQQVNSSSDFNKHDRHHYQSNISLMEDAKKRKFLLFYIGEAWVVNELDDPDHTSHESTEK